MKDNKLFDALTDIDEALIREAEQEPRKNAKTIKKRVFIALAAALLNAGIVMAALAIGGAFRAEDPPAVNTEPTVVSQTEEGETTNVVPLPVPSDEYFFLTGENDISIDEPDSAIRFAHKGLRALNIDGKTYLAIDEKWALFDVEGERLGIQEYTPQYLSRDSALFKALMRWYDRGCVTQGEYLYFTGGLCGCVVINDQLTQIERPGIFRMNLKTDRIEPLIAVKTQISALSLCGDCLYFSECSDDEMESDSIFRANLKTKEIALVWAPDRGKVNALAAREDGLFATAYDYGTCENAVLHYDYRTGKETVIRTQEIHLGTGGGYYRLVQIDAGTYVSAWSYNEDADDSVYLLEIPQPFTPEAMENAFEFSEEKPYPEAARTIGSISDEPTVYLGKLVAVKNHALILIDTITGEKSTLLSDVCYGNDNIVSSPLFTKTALGNMLYFFDATTGKLYTFADEELVRTTALLP